MARAALSTVLVAVLLALASAQAVMGGTNFTFSEHDLASEEALSALYERWCAHHGLTRDTGEKARRFSVFKDKARAVHEFNLGDAPYKLALNYLSDTRGYGATCVFSDLDVARARQQGFAHGALAATASDLPVTVDWRMCEVVTPVKDQTEECGSCWAFAAVSAIEGIYAINNNSLTALSEQQILDCAGPRVGNCSGGAVVGAFDYVIGHGLATEHDYPYEKEKTAICDDNDKSIPHIAFINGYKFVPPHDTMALMEQVGRQPVVVLIMANNTGFENYQEGVFVGPCDGTKLDHAATVVGYGTTPDGLNYWTLRNSWGTNWGEEGYMRISRDQGGPAGLCDILAAPMFPTCMGDCTQ